MAMMNISASFPHGMDAPAENTFQNGDFKKLKDLCIQLNKNS